MAVWCNADEANVILGRPGGSVVASGKLARAASDIEIAAGIFQTDANLSVTRRDLGWLKRAVAYQLAWLEEQADVDGRLDVSSMSQNGQSATLKADAVVTGPQATRCLRRLSWRGTRSIAIQGATAGPRGRYALDGEGDIRAGWRPL